MHGAAGSITDSCWYLSVVCADDLLGPLFYGRDLGLGLGNFRLGLSNSLGWLQG